MAKTSRTNHSVSHPFVMMSRSSRENIASMCDALKGAYHNDISLMLAYLPQRRIDFAPDGKTALIDIIGFKDKVYGNYGQDNVRSIYMDGNYVFLSVNPDGYGREGFEDIQIPLDSQDFKTLDILHKAVCDYVAEKFGIEYHNTDNED